MANITRIEDLRKVEQNGIINVTSVSSLLRKIVRENTMDVYISHANTDRKLAERLATTLRASGFNVWDDTHLSYGDTFSSSLDKALEQSNAMVVLLTPNTADSPYFAKEIEHALTNKAYKNRVIPVIATEYDQLDFQQIPWILKKFHVIHAPNLGKSGEGLEQISQALRAAS